MKDVYKLLTAFAVGAAAGAVIGILFSPDKGSIIREKMNRKGREMAEDVNDLLDKSKDKFSHMKRGPVKERKEPVDVMN